MREITTRNNEVYQRIEQLKTYEYTNCIVYEMMERSVGSTPEDIHKTYNKDTKGYSCTELDISHVSLSSRVTLRDYIFNIFPSLYEDISKKIKKENQKCTGDELKVSILNREISIKYIIQNYMQKDNVIFNEIFYASDEGKIEQLTQIKLKKIIEKINFSRMIVPHFGYNTVLPEDYKFVALYDINLVLPVDELVDYIKKIKNDFDTNKLDIDTASEVMSDVNKSTLKRYEQIQTYKKNGDKNKLINTFNIIKTERNAADMFYIYDQECQGFEKKEILNELVDHHGSFDTIRYDEYLLTAEKYIDEKYYLKLIK